MSTNLLKYNDSSEIGLEEGEESDYVELRLPKELHTYGEEIQEAVDYLENVEGARVRDDVGRRAAGYQPELLTSNPGSMGLKHVLRENSIQVENIKAALNHG